MYRYFDAWVPTEVRVRVRVGVRFRDPRFEIAVPRISGTRPIEVTVNVSHNDIIWVSQAK